MQYIHTSKSNFLSNKTRAGFTLVELMVSISILAVISTIVFVNHTSFRNSISLTNLAYDIALSVREAQSYGLNSRGDQGGFGFGYGVRFLSGNQTEYVTFVDLDGNKRTGPGEVLERHTLQEGNRITQICVNVIQGPSLGEQCSSVYNSVNVYITYKRPNPEPVFIGSNGYSDSATITISSPDGKTRDVFINQAGQITVQ